jgi:hypothetical protein
MLEKFWRDTNIYQQASWRLDLSCLQEKNGRWFAFS